MSNIIGFPINHLMKKSEDLAEAENHIIKYCFKGDEFLEENMEDLLDAIACVLSVHYEEEETVEYLQELIIRVKHLY